MPAVAFTKRGMYPYNTNKNIKYKIEPLSEKKSENNFRNVAIPFSSLKMFFFPCERYIQAPVGTNKLHT